MRREELHASSQAWWGSSTSVSNAIRRLEEELGGGDLFHRTSSGAELSPLGVAIRPYFEQINQCVEGARREAADISRADMVPISARAQFVRKVFYASTIPASALFVGVLFDHQPYSETAIRSMANTTVDVAALEANIT